MAKSRSGSSLRYSLRVVADPGGGRPASEDLPPRCVARLGRTPYTSAYYQWSATLAQGWVVQRHGDSTLRLVDRASGRTLQVLTVSTRIVRSLTVPEAKLALFSTADPWTVVHRWDLETGRVDSSAPGKSHPDAFAWHQASRVLAWGTSRSTTLRRFASGEVLLRMPPVGGCDNYEQGVVASLDRLAFSQDGKLLAGNTVFYEHHWYNDIGGMVTVYDVLEGKPLFEVGRYEKKVRSLRFSADGRALGVWFSERPGPSVQLDVEARHEVPVEASFDADPYVVNEALEQELVAAQPDLPRPLEAARRLWVAPRGTWLATDKELLRPSDGTRQAIGWSTERVFSLDGRSLLSASSEGVDRLVLDSGARRRLVSLERGDQGQAISPDGRSLVRIDKRPEGGNRAELTGLPSAEPMGSWALDVEPEVVLLSNHPTRIVLADSQGQVRILEPGTQRTFRHRVLNWENGVAEAALAALGTTLVVGDTCEAELVIVRLPAFDQRTIEIPAGETWVEAFAVSPSGELVAVAGKTPRIHLYRVSDGTWLEPLEGHLNEITALAFAADGEHLASVAKDGTALVWKVAEKAPWRRPEITSRPADTRQP